MGRNIFIVIILLSFASNLPAQDAQTFVGIKAGFNLSGIYTDSNFVTSKNLTKAGYNAALFIHHSFNKRFGAQGEIGFTQKGYKEDNQQIEVGYRYTMLDIPILFKYMFTAGRFIVYPEAGFFFGVGFKKRYEELTKKNDAEAFYVLPWEDKDNRFDSGLIGGIGTMYKRTGRGDYFLADIRYGYSFTAINVNSNSQYYYIAFSLGYAIPSRYFVKTSRSKLKI